MLIPKPLESYPILRLLYGFNDNAAQNILFHPAAVTVGRRPTMQRNKRVVFAHIVADGEGLGTLTEPHNS